MRISFLLENMIIINENKFINTYLQVVKMNNYFDSKTREKLQRLLNTISQNAIKQREYKRLDQTNFAITESITRPTDFYEHLKKGDLDRAIIEINLQSMKLKKENYAKYIKDFDPNSMKTGVANIIDMLLDQYNKWNEKKA